MFLEPAPASRIASKFLRLRVRRRLSRRCVPRLVALERRRLFLALALVASAASVVASAHVSAANHFGEVTFDATHPEGAAITATLTDPGGGVTGTTWAWETSTDRGATWTTTSGVARASYAPVADDVESILRAAASPYDDHGTGRSASATTASVCGKADVWCADMTTGANTTGVDYDRDDDGLIEVANLAQLNAIRWDLDGDGTPVAANKTDYDAAYPDQETGAGSTTMGCPAVGGCVGYELAANLDFDTDSDGDVDANDDYWNSGAGWDPIGDTTNSFEARFDGGGNTVSNLFISRSDAYVGLFGLASSGHELANVALLDVNVAGTGQYTGALAGASYQGVVWGVYVDGNVSGKRIAGMMLGANFGRAVASYAAGQVSGEVVGGLIGTNGESFQSGAVVASYSTASVTPTGAVSGWIYGGLIGESRSSWGSVTNGYWDTDTSGIASAYHKDNYTLAPGDPKTALDLQTPTGYTGIFSDWDNLDVDGDGTADTNTFWAFGTESQYPYLVWQGSPPPAQPIKNDYDLDDDGLIEIDNLHQLFALRWDLDGDGLPDDLNEQGQLRTVYPEPQGDIGCDVTACYGYELSQDLDFDSDGNGTVSALDDFWANFPWTDPSGDPWETTSPGTIPNYGFRGTGWIPIGSFGQAYTGVLDGGGNIISNLYSSGRSGYLGLFGELGAGGVVRDLGLLDADISNTDTADSGAFTGGFAASNAGVITAVRFDGSVANSNPKDATSVGGIAGESAGRINASYATGTISGSAATGTTDIGGLVGRNKGAIVSSYAAAAVGSGNAANTDVGGLVGKDEGGSVTASYWDTQTSGQSASAGGTGKSTRELQEPTGYTGIYADWDDIDLDGDATTTDTNDLWRFGTTGQYPVLWWEGEEVKAGTTDYDADDDGLIEVGSVAQLDALRYDLDGDGSPDDAAGVTPHGDAFPDAVAGMGCPDTGCSGYELTSNLDYDYDGSSAGWVPISSYNAVLEGNRFAIVDLGVNRLVANAGLFASLNARAEVRNLDLVDFSITNTDSGDPNSPADATAGALAGSNLGLVSDVSVEDASILSINGAAWLAPTPARSGAAG